MRNSPAGGYEAPRTHACGILSELGAERNPPKQKIGSRSAAGLHPRSSAKTDKCGRYKIRHGGGIYFFAACYFCKWAFTRKSDIMRTI
ncbi:MAG: hypothetical protein A2939_05695 [Parcubacteria group bacterium RIFCSPLOWO2_01_FULL_48_18]|nr:MAG: hypothetical protein A3J67_00855 [Parcubacteria group bacterium RIFCSPHIGHO2_02_FULL_48_10b]OHB22802.1 MAG: hypothetical protein A2939_05695 [Parcubacteria group bacterium RIFCSPLOWO2_01_FULL_48_18]